MKHGPQCGCLFCRNDREGRNPFDEKNMGPGIWITVAIALFLGLVFAGQGLLALTLLAVVGASLAVGRKKRSN